ncbi:hypothetical protein BAUCODRAFT_444961 [Baudoinia panamericana UAMH 10762]|uniref:GED domain-containing protein n=1 Tax=Baudoinia panamericana (strain UAMH 10762) TaxID=717646 RepID=M2NE66_BAUPA|nr:uncharacterized protein BAUCODRAFT_444961 [Baudoinia panamericana UAMH 10762]EMC97245.1 hypothetical protein BAUCODRAFT_444961 [Baudoinia panamericana UAMH 10762]
MSEQYLAGAFDATAIRSLQAVKHLGLLNVVDDLRAQGLNEHVDLPQLIVCGDQSSGKSSVLAAVSGVSFPKKDNLCTRFATEVVLRRDDALEVAQVSARITPSSTRPLSDRQALEAFVRELSSMENLPETIADAAMVMGLGAAGSAFSADILRLEVRGPQMPQLTIVDLPGLIHSENKFQTAEDVALVNALVEGYMSQERSIILAVVSAKNDYANQIVLAKARSADATGRRTLGIITKPDALHPKSTSERSFLSLARNQDIEFALGWHVVRNQDTNVTTEMDRDNVEAHFFSTSQWREIAEKDRGIHSLRDKLSQILFRQIRRELPELIREILLAKEDTANLLGRMGRSRATLSEKRTFVMEVGQAFRDLCRAACEGLYEDAFFDDLSSDNQSRRLRAAVENGNLAFAKRMLNLPVTSVIVHDSQGKLPGTFNPIMIGQLFRELSRPWFKYTREHANEVWLSARAAVVAMLETITEDYICDACMKAVIDPELESMQQAMETRLTEYMQEFRRQPITYNHYLTETVQAARYGREHHEAIQRCRELLKSRGTLTLQDVGLIVDAVVPRREPDMENIAARSLADYAEAYYRVALKRVIDEVPAHVIEPTILTALPTLLDAPTILAMSTQQIEAIGGESPTRTAIRRTLQAKLEVLDRSNLICNVLTLVRLTVLPTRDTTESPSYLLRTLRLVLIPLR